MKRILLDTCVVVEMLLDATDFDKDVVAILEDPDNQLCASFETMRELVVLYNNKKIRSKRWKKAEDVINTVQEAFELDFLPLHPQVGITYSRLQINEGQNHYDPSDHIIISHAITEHIPLISCDKKFSFYRNQGLELIEY